MRIRLKWLIRSRGISHSVLDVTFKVVSMSLNALEDSGKENEMTPKKINLCVQLF